MDKRKSIISVILYAIASFSPKSDVFAQEGYIVEKIKHNYEILVEPQRREIYNGEQTTITIDVHDFDTAGLKIQAFNAAVVISITGLIDGKVTPASGSKIITDQAGIAWLDYKAGEKDKEISVMATFIPEGSATEYIDEATVTVKPLEYEATLTVSGSSINMERSSYSRKQSDGIERGNHSLDERYNASFYVPLKLDNSGDMPILNQRWEYYRPLDINLTQFNASYLMKEYEYANFKGFGHEATIIRIKKPLNIHIPGKEYLMISNIILIIDKETDKVVKIGTGGYPVEFHWDETESRNGRSWNPDGSEPISYFNHKTDDLSTTFTPGPVEDPVVDPTFTGVAESLTTYLKNMGTPLPADIEIPEDDEKAEVAPDLLVEYGDGKTFFGGKGKKIIDNSEGSNINRKEMTFNWSVTRRKKQ
ncbi:MAG TPA: hypothetical protein PLR52_06770 [Bacteroidales bacterium]|nr:hypothetical protein [Bacteroidales bacterium]HPI69312.1 hypothetical protein [Bacteroidales bacterium]HPR74135.1 hypothetical protein [Bacteroidales bacterium]